MGNLERRAVCALNGEVALGSGGGLREPQLLAMHNHGDSAVVLFAVRGTDGEVRALLSYLERSEPEGWHEHALFGFGWFEDFERPAGADPGRPPVEVVGEAEASSSEGVQQRMVAGRAAGGLSTIRPEGSGTTQAARVDPQTGSFVVMWPVEPGREPHRLIAVGPGGEDAAIEIPLRP